MATAPWLQMATQAASGIGAGGGMAQAVAGAAIQQVTFRSQISPEVTVQPFSPTPPAPPGPNLLMSLVRPSIEIQTAGGVMSIAPYGEPSANYFPWLVAGTVLALFGFVGVVALVARRVGR